MIISDLLPILQERLSKFTCSVVNEQLEPLNTSYLRYDAIYKNWATYPAEQISVSVSGVTSIVMTSDYTVNGVSGFIVFDVARAATDVVIANYTKSPFTDDELTAILNSALNQVRVMCFHYIDSSSIPVNYSEAIVLKAMTICMREIQLPTTKYYSLSVAGRAIDKSMQVEHIEALIKGNEEDYMRQLNSIRYYDKTDVLS